MNTLSLLLIVSFSVFVLVVRGADNNDFNNLNPDGEVAGLLYQAGTLKSAFKASLTEPMAALVAEPGLSSSHLIFDVSERLKELDMLIGPFDKKCDAVMEKLEQNFKGVMGRFPDLSNSPRSAESLFLSYISFYFDCALKVLNKEPLALQEEISTKAQELFMFVNVKVQRCYSEVFNLVETSSTSEKIKELMSQFLKYQEQIQVMLALPQHIEVLDLLQSFDVRDIVQKKVDQAFSMTWRTEAKRFYDEFNTSVSQLQKQVAEWKRKRERCKSKHDDALVSFYKFSSKCLTMSATSYERKVREKEKLLRELVQLNKKHYRKRMRVEILLAKDIARLRIEESKIAIFTECFSGTLKSEEESLLKH